MATSVAYFRIVDGMVIVNTGADILEWNSRGTIGKCFHFKYTIYTIFIFINIYRYICKYSNPARFKSSLLCVYNRKYKGKETVKHTSSQEKPTHISGKTFL